MTQPQETNQERIARYHQEYPLIISLIDAVAAFDEQNEILGKRDRAFQTEITTYATYGTLEEKAEQIEAYVLEEGLTRAERSRLLGHLYNHRNPQGE